MTIKEKTEEFKKKECIKCDMETKRKCEGIVYTIDGTPKCLSKIIIEK